MPAAPTGAARVPISAILVALAGQVPAPCRKRRRWQPFAVSAERWRRVERAASHRLAPPLVALVAVRRVGKVQRHGADRREQQPIALRR